MLDPTAEQRSGAQQEATDSLHKEQMQARTEAPSADAQVGWSFLRTSRWFGYFTMLIIFSIACVYLGNWQFDRRAQARAEIERLDANYGSEAAPLAEELPGLTDFDLDTQKWRTVWVSGEYIGDPYLARNRPGPGRSGSDLIQPLRADDGRVFFVDRGWVPIDGATAEAGGVDFADLPQAPEGTVRVEARLRASEPEIPGRTSSGDTVASIELPELARLADSSDVAYTGAYGMLVSETPAGEHGILPEEPERDEGPHLSYALQWYVFIMIAAIGVAVAARREYRSLNPDSSAVREQDRREAERRKRRGPSDADVEDALTES